MAIANEYYLGISEELFLLPLLSKKLFKQNNELAAATSSDPLHAAPEGSQGSLLERDLTCKYFKSLIAVM